MTRSASADSEVRLRVAVGLIRAAAAGSMQWIVLITAQTLGLASGGVEVLWWTGTTYFLAEAAASFLGGRAVDRWGPRAVGRAGALAGAGALIGLWLGWRSWSSSAETRPLLAACRAMEGLAAGCTTPAALTALARASDAAPRARQGAMARFELASLAGMFFGLVGAGVAFRVWERHAILPLSLVYLAAAALLPRSALALAPSSTTQLGPLRVLAGRRDGRALMVSWLAVNAVVGLWMQHGPHLLASRETAPGQRLVGGWDGMEVSALMLAYGLAIGAGIATWSRLIPRGHTRLQLISSLAAMLAVVPVIAWINHGGPRGPLGALLFLLVMAESGFAPAALARLSEATQEHDHLRGRLLGVYSLLLAGGQLVGVSLGSMVARPLGMDGLLLLTAFLAACSLALVASSRWVEPGRGG